MARFLSARTVVIAVFIVAIAAVALYVGLGRGSAAVQYRTAAAITGTVTQTLPISGNLTPVNQTDLDFGSSGRVKALSVQAGDSVTTGQVLSALDPSSLEAALAQAQAALAQAQYKLSQDRTATPQSLAQAHASVTSAAVALQNSQTSLGDAQASNQQSLAQAQDQITLAKNKLKRDTDQESADCAPVTPLCASDQRQVQSDNDAVTAANDGYQAAVVKGQQGFNQALGQVNTAKVNLQNAQAAMVVLQQGGTAPTIQIDQSQILVAQVNVDTAQRNLSQATLVAPVDGVVGLVTVAVGQTVSGSGASSGGGAATTASSSSTTHAISIQSPGSFAVTGSISDAQIGEVVVGQPARVTPAGSSQALNAKVTQVAAAATVTSGVATFAVTVTLSDNDPALHAGTSAAVSIIINQVSQVLTVPTTAVRGSGAAATVQVLVAGVLQSRAVQVGASDALRTQVTSGLNPGDQVLIATVSRTVPTTTGGNGGGLLGNPGGGGRVRGGGGGAGGGG